MEIRKAMDDFLEAIKESEASGVVAKIVETGYGKDVPREVGTRFDYR